jgi:hypothetical protein
MVSVLDIGPKVRGFNQPRDNGYFRAIKFRSTPFFGGESEPSIPCRKILWQVKKSLLSMNKNISKVKFIIFFPCSC